MDIAAEQRHWLQTLQSLSKRPLKVSKNVNGKPTKWISLEEAELPADYRTVLHNEVVIDIDAERWREVRMFAEIITDTLTRLNIPHIKAYSGGRGIHIHLFFDLSSNQKKACDETDVMPKDVRLWLFEYVVRNAGIAPKLIGVGKPFDTSCVNWSDEGKGHLIRLFGGRKEKYKTLLFDIPEERPKKDEVVFPEDVDVWRIPDAVFQEFMGSFKTVQKERVEATQKCRKASQNFSGTFLNLPCVCKLLEGVGEGQRNAGARIVAIAARLDNYEKEVAKEVMRAYARNCPPENISEREYLDWIDWIYAQEEYFWNCRFPKEVGVCNEETCPFFKAAFQKELEFLKREDLIDAILHVLGKKIKKDEKNKLLVFFVCLSAYGSNPLNLFLKGESSIGKTHLARTVAEYFPSEDVWFIGDMSPKALIHGHGEYKDGKVYISLKNKILVFLETPRKETLEMLKPILSHDRTEIEYKITDKTLSGQLGTKQVIVKGWPSTVFCTTDYQFLEELSTRSMLTTPEGSPEKIREVLEYKATLYAFPWKYAEDQEEKTLRDALTMIRSGVEVCVPYAGVLAQQNEKDEPRVMRDFDKLMGLIKMSAFLHQGQRAGFTVDGKQFVIANECDYWVGMSLFDSVRETTCTGIPQPVIDFYEKVITPIEGTLSYQSMREEYVRVYKKPLSRTHLRNRFVEPLEDVGWLNHDPDPEDGRRVIFEKCRLEGDNNGGVQHERSYFKEMFGEDRLREYVGALEGTWKEGGGGVLQEDDAGSMSPWFYTSRVPYFLEHNGNKDNEITENTDVKNGSSIILPSLEEKKADSGISKNELLDVYDEETVLLQIPQEDTLVEDVVKKFKDQNKVVDTLVILRDKKRILVGQGHVRRPAQRRLVEAPVPTSVNTWRCGECGISFSAKEPYRDWDDHAICEACWENLGPTRGGTI